MVDYNSLIDQHLRRESRPKVPGRYYPSEVGSCLRKVWYSYVKPKALEPEKIRIFEAGNIVHSFLAEVFRSERVKDQVQLLQEELPVKLDTGEFLVSGRVDDLLLVKESGKTTLVEVKSTSRLDYVNEPQAQHAMQLQFYMHATGVHNGVLLYVEKNTLQAKSFDVPYDDRVAADAMARFTLLHHALLESKVPAPEAKLKSDTLWQCRYCEYRQECDAQEVKDTGRATPVP
jgi:CRISPR-associated exonuclease Cas4